MIDIYRFPQKGHGYIYRYISPNGKSYVGQTTTSLAKRSGKRGKQYMGCKVFYKAILKYGFENFRVEILGEFEVNQLDKKEKYFIEQYNSLAPNGYNVKVSLPLIKSKPVLQIDPETHQILNVYDSASAAARALGLKRSTGISKCCNGQFKKSAGYEWQFLQSSTTKDL